MNKRQFYKLLSEKYDLPLEYIRFTVDPIYIYNGNKKTSMDELNAIENAIRWDYVKEDFERDRHRKESVFYEMWEQKGIRMRIHTIEGNYDYRMKRLIKKFVKDYELESLNAEELQNKLWNEYSKEFAQTVLEDMQEFSGDELFENVTE